MSSPKTILITGATGFIGSRLATQALALGYSVRTLTRSDWTTAPAVPVENRYFGVLPARIPIESLRGVDVIVHCAAETEKSQKVSYAVNVEGTSRLAQMACQSGVKTFVFLSSQSARPDALSSYGKTKFAAEQQLLNIKGVNTVILRSGLVTGLGSRGLFHRMDRMIRLLPIIPLLDGGRSIVQPIHIDDLCQAIFLCCERSPKLDGTILRLGDPEGMTLADFYQAVALSRLGHRKLTLPIPLRPIQLLVKLAEALQIRLPINSNNLLGLKIVEKMDTREDLKRLGLTLRSIDQAVAPEPIGSVPLLSLKERAARVLLVGAGRVGLVHAITLSRLDGIELSGMVDPLPAATKLLKGMGVSAPAFRSLSAALSETKADAAVIASPVSTHLQLTRDCLAQGLSVMVEKPLAIRQEQLTDYERLIQEFPDARVQVGYVLPSNPHIAHCLNQLKAGRYGQIRGFLGFTLLAFIQEKDTKRWEVRKDISGGGALINSGGHVLSMIRFAFGDPKHIEAQSAKLCSTEVEDAIVIRFDYSEFSGIHYCSWSINGFPRQENTLVIETDQGQLILTNSTGIFVPHRGQVQVVHQLDFDVGFNMAPDYAGGGFSLELSNLKKAARTHLQMPIGIQEGIQLERLLFQIYEVSRDVKQFTIQMPKSENTKDRCEERRDKLPTSATIKRILDLRSLSSERAHAYLNVVPDTAGWKEYLLTATQVSGLSSDWSSGRRIRVTVPDFLAQSRLLSAGRYGDILKQMSLAGIMRGGLAALGLMTNERGVTFWVAAMGLLAAALENVPTQFNGTLLLHPYLTDFAFGLRRLDILEKMITTCRQIHPHARIGFHTNLASEALDGLWLLESLVDEVSVLSSPCALNMETLLGEMRRASSQSGFTLTSEVGPAPEIVHRVAFDAPERWGLGADAVLIGPGADPALSKRHREQVAREWTKVFPGLAMPENIL